jgi:hypothetical protein
MNAAKTGSNARMSLRNGRGRRGVRQRLAADPFERGES